MCDVGENTVKGYTKLINKSGAYTEIANTGTESSQRIVSSQIIMLPLVLPAV